MKRNTSRRLQAQGDPEFFSSDVSAARRFYLDLNPSGKSDLVVVCGGCEHCTPDYEIHRQSFPFYSIEYVVQGRGTVRLNGEEHGLQPGRVFAYGPGVSQDITGDPGAPLVKYFVDFAGRGAMALLRSCRLEPGRVAQVHPPHAIQVLFDELIDCGLRGTRQGAALTAKLLECLALRIDEARAPAEGPETLAFTTYEQCRQYIQQNWPRLRTLEQISRECHVNAAYLCRLFRRYHRQSPYQYLVRLKMNHAAQLLQEPDAMVKTVAEKAGFRDPFHFSRVFKSVLGMSPNAFRCLRTAKG